MPKTPNPRFVMIGKGKYVHVVHTAAYDRKNSGCQSVRKALVADKIDYKAKGLSPEAALALDPCTNCGTTEVAKRMLPAESKRASAKDKRDEVLERAKGDKPKGKSKAKEVKEAKPKAAPKPTKAKSGMRSVGSDTDTKAKALFTFMSDNGWSTEITEDKDTGHTVVRGTHGDQTIEAFFIDGKYDVARHAYIAVGAWRGTLRGAHAVRRQVDRELDDRDRPHPHPGKGRTGPKAKREEEPATEESPEDAKRRVPFSMDDESSLIIDMVRGKVIRWRNGVSGNIEEAWLPSKPQGKKRPLITISEHPKTGKRMIDFLTVDSIGEHGEVYGPERTVRLDKIIRVVG